MKCLEIRKKSFDWCSMLVVLPLCFLAGCKTTYDFEKNANMQEYEQTDNEQSVEVWEQQNEAEMRGIFIDEALKVQDIEDTVVFVDRPVYVPVQKDVPELERGNKTGYDAAVESQKRATIKPEQYKQGTFYYQYNENLVYEVYAQPYHLTDIILEPGEIVTGAPLLSEDEAVWELTAGVAKDGMTGTDVQHLFIKPAYSKLDSSLVIITDRRVYHFRIKSFADTHMAMVKFTYPTTRSQWLKKQDKKLTSLENDFVRVSNPAFISVDYEMKYSLWHTPEFLPELVYDDGETTYIRVDEIVLHKKLPVLFNEKNEIVNYTVKKNVFEIPQLMNEMTLRLGKQKVTIKKKKMSKKKAAALSEAEYAESGK